MSKDEPNEMSKRTADTRRRDRMDGDLVGEWRKLEENSIILFEKTLIFTPGKEIVGKKRLPRF
jgi:hypothetical protein